MNNYEIHRKANKTGKRAVFYPTVNGKRLTKTNFSQKWEARNTLRNAIKFYGEAKLHQLSTK